MHTAVPLSHLGQSDHLSLVLIPAYTLLKRRSRSYKVTVRTWPNLISYRTVLLTLTGGLFQHQDLAAYTESFIRLNSVLIMSLLINAYKSFPNRSPGWTVRSAHFSRTDAAFRTGAKTLYSVTRAKLWTGINEAKEVYRKKIEDHLSENDSRQMWQDRRSQISIYSKA